MLARRRKGMTQAEVAALAGMSRNYLSMIERGAPNPSHTIIATICSALDLDWPDDMPKDQEI